MHSRSPGPAHTSSPSPSSSAAAHLLLAGRRRALSHHGTLNSAVCTWPRSRRLRAHGQAELLQGSRDLPVRRVSHKRPHNGCESVLRTVRNVVRAYPVSSLCAAPRSVLLGPSFRHLQPSCRAFVLLHSLRSSSFSCLQPPYLVQNTNYRRPLLFFVFLGHSLSFSCRLPPHHSSVSCPSSLRFRSFCLHKNMTSFNTFFFPSSFFTPYELIFSHYIPPSFILLVSSSPVIQQPSVEIKVYLAGLCQKKSQPWQLLLFHQFITQ